MIPFSDEAIKLTVRAICYHLSNAYLVEGYPCAIILCLMHGTLQLSEATKIEFLSEDEIDMSLSLTAK